MNAIPDDQNAEPQLTRLAAQRQLYEDAKRLYLGEVVAGLPLALGLTSLAIWIPQARTGATVACLLLLLLDVVVIIPRQRWLRERAARIQEAFDCEVLRMDWRDLPCGKRSGAEFVLEYAERFRSRGGDEAKLRDWYPLAVKELPLHLARIVCQRTNCWWDGSQRRRYAWLGVGLVSSACGLLVLGVVATGRGADGAASAVVPLLPSLYFAARQFVEHRAAALRVDRLRAHAETQWGRAISGELSAVETARASRDLQDAIFDHRCQSPSTIDRIYYRLRPAYETQMNKGAEAMIEEARRADTKTGSPSQVEPPMTSEGGSPARPLKPVGASADGSENPTASAVSNPQASLPPTPKSEALTVLCIATEWASGRGGLSTFNREFALACVRSGHQVLCFVPSVSAEDIESARLAGVELVTARATPGITEERRLFQRPNLPGGIVPDVIVGHGRVTGPAAKLLAEEHFAGARRVHVLHMAPGAIEWFKDRPVDRLAARSATEEAEARERLEVELAESAQLVAAVGPLLVREFGTLLHSRSIKVHEILPGMPDVPQATGPAPAYQCLVLGRAEDATLKGLDIAARAIAVVAARRPDLRLHLVIRGAPPGTGDDLQKEILGIAVRGLDVRVRAYSSEADRIADDIRQSSLVLMPSRSEGFGLVGLEAISMGVPVLLSERSGIAEAIARDAREHARGHLVPVTCELEADVAEWARRIEFTLADRRAAFQRAQELRLALMDTWTWAGAIDRLFAPLLDDISQRNIR
jgi:glycosyltransferase involved in cell wall biosynthesis